MSAEAERIEKLWKEGPVRMSQWELDLRKAYADYYKFSSPNRPATRDTVFVRAALVLVRSLYGYNKDETVDVIEELLLKEVNDD